MIEEEMKTKAECAARGLKNGRKGWYVLNLKSSPVVINGVNVCWGFGVHRVGSGVVNVPLDEDGHPMPYKFFYEALLHIEDFQNNA